MSRSDEMAEALVEELRGASLFRNNAPTVTTDDSALFTATFTENSVIQLSSSSPEIDTALAKLSKNVQIDKRCFPVVEPHTPNLTAILGQRHRRLVLIIAVMVLTEGVSCQRVRCWGNHRILNMPPDLAYGHSHVNQVCAGGFHVCAVQMNGTVRCWGANNINQADVPFEVATATVRSVSCGYDTNYAIFNESYMLQCWGRNDFGQCNIPTDLGRVRLVSGGYYHACAIRMDDTIRCWGRNHHGQCNAPFNLPPALSVATGNWHSCALLVDGTVQCWGYNHLGQCNVPEDLGTVEFISTTNDFVCALQSNGSVVCWGDNGAGQCNVPDEYNVNTTHLLSAGGHHTCAMAARSPMRCWGTTSEGVLQIPSQIGNVLSIATGKHSTCVITSSLSDSLTSHPAPSQTMEPTESIPAHESSTSALSTSLSTTVSPDAVLWNPTQIPTMEPTESIPAHEPSISALSTSASPTVSPIAIFLNPPTLNPTPSTSLEPTESILAHEPTASAPINVNMDTVGDSRHTDDNSSLQVYAGIVAAIIVIVLSVFFVWRRRRQRTTVPLAPHLPEIDDDGYVANLTVNAAYTVPHVQYAEAKPDFDLSTNATYMIPRAQYAEIDPDYVPSTNI